MCKDKAEEKKEQFLEIFSPEERDKVAEFFDKLISDETDNNEKFSLLHYEDALIQYRDVLESVYYIYTVSISSVDKNFKTICPLLKLLYNESIRCYNRFADIGSAICKTEFSHAPLTEDTDGDLKTYLEKFRKQSEQQETLIEK